VEEQDMNKKANPLGYVLVGTVALCMVCVGIWLGIRQVAYEMTATPLRKALPPTAQDIHEQSWGEGGEIGQDYCYLLKARITPAEFQQYVDRFGLTPHIATQQYSNWSMINCGTERKPDWWTPSDESGSMYARDEDSTWTYAKYENGYIFVVSYSI
jgi:hypothetical protein